MRSDLRERIIERIMQYKNGYPGCTPQPDFARDALRDYDKLLPHLELMQGVREALK